MMSKLFQVIRTLWKINVEVLLPDDEGAAVECA